MQYSCGSIKQQDSSASPLLPGYERGGWRMQESRQNGTVSLKRTFWLYRGMLSGNDLPVSSPNVASFVYAVEEVLYVKTAPFLSASMIGAAAAADSRARSSERQRERTSRSPFAGSLHFRPRQVRKPASRLVSVFSHFDTKAQLGSCKRFPYIAVWRYGAHLRGGNAWQSSGTGQPPFLPPGHNNKRSYAASISQRLFQTLICYAVLAFFLI